MVGGGGKGADRLLCPAVRGRCSLGGWRGSPALGRDRREGQSRKKGGAGWKGRGRAVPLPSGSEHSRALMGWADRALFKLSYTEEQLAQADASCCCWL